MLLLKVMMMYRSTTQSEMGSREHLLLSTSYEKYEDSLHTACYNFALFFPQHYYCVLLCSLFLLEEFAMHTVMKS